MCLRTWLWIRMIFDVLLILTLTLILIILEVLCAMIDDFFCNDKLCIGLDRVASYRNCVGVILDLAVLSSSRKTRPLRLTRPVPSTSHSSTSTTTYSMCLLPFFYDRPVMPHIYTYIDTYTHANNFLIKHALIHASIQAYP